MEARSGLASLSPFRPQEARIGKHVVVQKTEPRGPFSYSVQLAEPRNVQVFCLHSAVISLGEYTDGVRLIIKFFLSGFREKSSLSPFLSLLGEQYSQRAVHWKGAMQAVPGRLLGLSGSILPSRETGLGNISVRIAFTLEFAVSCWY